jgi:hypothetical protein
VSQALTRTFVRMGLPPRAGESTASRILLHWRSTFLQRRIITRMPINAEDPNNGTRRPLFAYQWGDPKGR